MLEPELMTNLFDRSRVKRRIVKFNEIPPMMVNALLSAEINTFSSITGSIRWALCARCTWT